MITRTLKLLKIPDKSFNPNGEYTHIYADGTPFLHKHLAGKVTIRRKPKGLLHIESYRNTMDATHKYFTIAYLKCRNDELSTPDY